MNWMLNFFEFRDDRTEKAVRSAVVWSTVIAIEIFFMAALVLVFVVGVTYAVKSQLRHLIDETARLWRGATGGYACKSTIFFIAMALRDAAYSCFIFALAAGEKIRKSIGILHLCLFARLVPTPIHSRA